MIPLYYPLVLAILLLQEAAAPTLYQTGIAQLGRREFAAAAATLEKAIAEEKPGTPRYAEMAFFLGQAYFLAARNAEAIPWLERSLTAGVRNPEAVYMIGTAAVQSRDIARARKAFAALYGVPPESASAHLLTAQMMVRQEFEEFAMKELEAALEKDSRIPEANYLLGVMYTFRNDIDKAIAALSREIAINPNFAMAYYKLGDAYSRREQWNEAIPMLQKSVWLNPNYSGPYILLGKAYFRLNQLPNAEGMLRRAIQMDPNNFTAHYQLGQTLLKLGKTEEGRKLLERSQQLRKTNEEP